MSMPILNREVHKLKTSQSDLEVDATCSSPCCDLAYIKVLSGEAGHAYTNKHAQAHLGVEDMETIQFDAENVSASHSEVGSIGYGRFKGFMADL